MLPKITYDVCFHSTTPEVLSGDSLRRSPGMADKTLLFSSFPCPQKLVENPESDLCVCLPNFHETFKFPEISNFLFSFVDILLI